MNILSKVALTYNAGVTGQESSVVAGYITNTSRNGNCSWLGANFTYVNNDFEGEKKPIILQGAFELKTVEEIQALYEIIKADLPSTDNEPVYESTKYYMAFRLEMFKTFLPLNPDLKIEDLEIVE